MLMVQGLSGVAIGERVGYTVVQVSRIRRRSPKTGVGRLGNREESGRPLTASAPKRAQTVPLNAEAPAGCPDALADS